MKKLFMIAAVAALGFGMASCAKEGTTPDNGGFGAKTDVDLIIQTKVDGSTRAPEAGTAAESVVSSLELYVFGADGTTLDPAVNADGTPGYLSYAGPAFEAALGTDGRFVTQVAMSAGTAQVLAVTNANLGDFAAIATKLTAQGQTETAATVSLYDIMGVLDARAMSATNTREIPGTGFVMAGFNLNAPVLAERSDNRIAVDIYRDVAKIKGPVEGTTKVVAWTQAEFDKVFNQGLLPGDVGYVTITPQILGAVDFSITGYAVVSGLVKSTAGFVGVNAAQLGNGFDPAYNPTTKVYGNEWLNWVAGSFTHPGDVYDGAGGVGVLLTAGGTTPAGEALRGGRIISNAKALKDAGAEIDESTAATELESLRQWTNVYSGTFGTALNATPILPLTEIVYAYESKPGEMVSEGYTGFNADQVIAYIIQGDVTWNGRTETRYWRANIRSQEAYHFIRNSVYSTTIGTLVTGGYDTPWEAEESEDIVNKPGDTSGEFTISVTPWDSKLVGNGSL